MAWNILPAELRWMIFDHLCDLRNHIRPEERHTFVNYARVCKEWNWHWEAECFNNIVLDQDRISDFDKFVTNASRRRRCLKQIYLRVKLPNYDCCVCHDEGNMETTHLNNLTFTKAVVDLFAVLSKWPSRAMRPDLHMSMMGGLTLDITAFSPSDYQHGFRDYRLRDDYPVCFNFDVWDPSESAFDEEKELKHAEMLRLHHDPSLLHGWENGTPGPVNLGTRQQLTTKLSLVEGAQILRTPAVTALTIRRQSYRPIDMSSLRRILWAVPRIRVFIHEAWFEVTTERQRDFENRYQKLLKNVLIRMKKLEHVILFQDSSKMLNPEVPSNGHGWVPSHRAKRLLISQELARTSRQLNLKLLSAAFLVDAHDFFHEFATPVPQPLQDALIWDRLAEVNLTSRHLHYCKPPEKRQEILCRAGRAAALMPSLEYMTLWNGGEGNVYIMRYLRLSMAGKPVFLLVSSHQEVLDSDFSPQVLEVWRLVPRNSREPTMVEPEVVIRKCELPAAFIKSAYTAVEEIRAMHIAHQVSIHQMVMEETCSILKDRATRMP